MKRVDIPPGYEIRGFKIRLYPDKETETKLFELQDQLRSAWNWLVNQVEDQLEAFAAYAIRHKLVSPRPTSPDYKGLTSQEAKELKREYLEKCREWRFSVFKVTKEDPNCSFRTFKELLVHYGFKHDYQLLGRVLHWKYGNDRTIKPNAHILAALTKNYFSKSEGQRRKTFKSKRDYVPLQVRSGHCFSIGDYGTRRGNPYYNCQVKINGLRIRGRLPGVSPQGRVMEGVSLKLCPDGWYASIKQVLPIRKMETAIPGSVVGIDVGLDNIVAMSDGTLVTNPRDKSFADKIALMQWFELSTGRLHQKFDRKVKHLLYNDIIKPLANIETIKLEHLESKIGQLGSSKVSVMRLVYSIIKSRYGDRVREVDAAYTSQDCSQCGERSKKTWSYSEWPICKCPYCGYVAHRDINAARNIAARDPIS